MKIIVTGSLGNIGKPLTEELVQKGHAITVVSSNPDKQKDIESLGATAAVGSIEDIDFLTKTFAGADAVYCMIPMSFTEVDQAGYMRRMAQNYLQALKQTKIKRIVLLSGWSADLVSGQNVEGVFSELPNASITYMRPGYFYTNFYSSMDMIRGKGLVGNFGGDDRIVFVSPKDIAAAVAEELLAVNPEKTKIRYVGSEEMTCNEAAKIIGTAVGKPDLKWALISDAQMLQGLEAAKMPAKIAEGLVEMQAAVHSGAALENFHKNNPQMGKVKLKDFAKEFATVYYK